MSIQNNSFHMNKLFSLPLQNYHYAHVDFPQGSIPPLTFRPPQMAWPLLLNIDASFTPRPSTTRTQHSSFRRQCPFISPVLHSFFLCTSLHLFLVSVLILMRLSPVTPWLQKLFRHLTLVEQLFLHWIKKKSNRSAFAYNHFSRKKKYKNVLV